MSRAGAVLGIAALLGLGGYAALPDDGPAYLGDMPSIIEQAEGAPSSPAPFVPPPPGPAPDPLAAPEPVVPEEPPPVGPPVAAERVPAPVTDVPQQYRPGAGGNGDGGGSPFELPLPVLPTLPIPCVDVFEPGVGLIDCLTGELLQPDDPALPNPCELVPLPVGCPVLPPD
jgi:hypothetical protein